MLILLNINLLLTILSTIRPMFYIAKDIEYFSEGIQYSICLKPAMDYSAIYNSCIAGDARKNHPYNYTVREC